ncbi:MAG: hypothetical protein JF886_10020 [Candidatus Dormibacteraeota bacterium]|uniref:GP-PDE domain-containing protein n=1 Tax=Candidatus Aeolococcus gillhamiae TaxID=3127015 RepID=A0A934JW79_9BACT|nr:hypothetical protein [Candidatus Dormibacteraeota bacterium]
MVRSPAGTLKRPGMARHIPGLPGDHPSPFMQVIGHAGLAVEANGGSPTGAHLDQALVTDVDRLELDICSTADSELVVRHDGCRRDGRLIADVEMAELRCSDPGILTVDEAVEHLDGRVPILFDITTARAAQLLGLWFRGRSDLDDFATCTENVPWLLHLRFAAPSVARWPSFPDIGGSRSDRAHRVVAGLWRSHASLDGLRRGAADVSRAALQVRRAPRDSLSRLGGLLWRERLPQE